MRLPDAAGTKVNPLNPTNLPKPNVYDPYLANANPQLYAASVAGQPAKEDLQVVNSVQKILAIDSQLNQTHSLNDAKNKYDKLDKDIKGALKFLNPNADYMQPKKSFTSQVLSAGNLLSPFRTLLSSAEAVMKVPLTNARMARNAFIAGSDTPGGEAAKWKAQFEYLLKAKNWSDAWDGHNQWDEPIAEELDQKHGAALGYFVRGQIDGKKPGDLIREYGRPMDAPLQEAIMAMSDYNSYLWYKSNGQEKEHPMSPAAKAYADARDDFYRHQRSFGRDVSAWANKNHPPKDTNWWTKLGLAASLNPLIIAPFETSKDKQEWVALNPNPFSKEKFRDISGSLDALYDITIDPLTFLTGGSVGAITRAERIADKFIAAGKAGVSPEIRVADVFADPSFYKAHEQMVPVLNELRAARAAKSPEAGVILTKFKMQFGKYDNPIVLNHLLNTKVENAAGDLVHITDMDTLQRFFERGEMMNFIVSGRVHNIGYYRENHVMLERDVRLGTNKARKAFEKTFNGIDSTAPNGVASETSIAARAASIEKVFSKRRMPGALEDPEVQDTIKELTKHGSIFTRNYAKMMAMHPEDVQIFTADNKVLKSIDAFRDFARVLTGDKVTANMMGEWYLNSSADERFNMLFSMFKIYTDKIGLSATPEGLIKQRVFLESIFGDGIGLGPIADFKTPAHLFKDGVTNIPAGASQIFHTTEGISMPRFEKLFQELYDTERSGKNTSAIRNAIHIMRSFSYSSPARITGQLWTLAQLFPKLGIRGATDEATIALFTVSPKAIYSFVSGKGRAISNIRAAYAGDSKDLGMIKSMLMGDRSPDKFVSARERAEMQADVKVDVSFTLPSGKEIKRWEWVSADEYHGAPYEERLANKVIARFGGKLTDEERGWLQTHLMNNSHSMESLSQSAVAASFGNTMVKGSMVSDIWGKNELAKFLDEQHLKQTGEFRTVAMKDLSESSITQGHYDAFWRYFAKNVYSPEKGGKIIDFGEAFIRHNAMRTIQDGENYVAEILSRLGDDTEYFIKRFGQTTDLKLTGKTTEQIAEGIIRKQRDELYTIFHGSDDVFNENLLAMLKFKIKEAAEKVGSRKDFRASDQHMRNYAKKPNPFANAKAAAAKAKWEAKQYSASYHAGKTSFAEFEEVTRGYRFKGETLKTELDLKEIPNTAVGQFKKAGKMMWEMMDRQINDLYRADAFSVKLLEQRAKLKPDQEKHIQDLVDVGTKRDDAVLQADILFDNRATSNAVDELMKYADNPNVRSQLAFNMRSVGRFNRATEDYGRRMYRFLVDHPEKVVYRAGHLNQAMDASGVIYDDDQGNKYILIPNDGIFWNTIAPAFAAIMNPATTIVELGKGLISDVKGEREKAVSHYTFFKQPQWNQYMGKISMLNPSYSDSAGVVSLQGPTMAATVLGLRQMFNAMGNPAVGEELDNLILGPMSDNTTWVRALLPSSITNMWKILDPDLKDGVYATSIMQAAAFMQAHDLTRLNPEDFGNIEKTQQYYDRLGMAAHNTVIAKLSFNTISGVPLTATEPGVNPLLRKAGITSFTQEFSDILRAVYEVNAEYGYQNTDPIGLAVSAFVGQYPDRLIYTIGKNSEAAKTYINYTKESKKWVLNSEDLIKKYGNVAFVFAPHTGDYDPAVARYLQATGIIPENQNPFNSPDGPQTSPLYRYIKEISVAKARAEYYDKDRFLQEWLTDPNNPDRNEPVSRQRMIEQTAAQKANIINGNPTLKYVMGTSDFDTRQQLLSRFNALDQLVSDPEFISKSDPKVKPQGDKGKLPEGQRGLIQLMTKQVNSMLVVLEDKNIRTQYEGQLYVAKVYREGIEQLKKLSVGQPAASEAYQSVIYPLLQDVYRIPTAGVTK